MESLEEVLARERAKESILLVREPVPGSANALFARGSGMENLTVIDDGIRDQARINVLDAHELGHHRFAAQNEFGIPCDLFGMAPAFAELLESLAEREAASICLAPERVIAACLEGCTTAAEFADALEITEDALCEWFEIMQHRYGNRPVNAGAYEITFWPAPVQVRKAGRVPVWNVQ